VRRLGIPAIAGRVVQAALKLVLEPIFEAGFKPVSYGCRPRRGAHDAIAEIHAFGTKGYRLVLDADPRAAEIMRPPPNDTRDGASPNFTKGRTPSNAQHSRIRSSPGSG
jgi:hypothetical protein